MPETFNEWHGIVSQKSRVLDKILCHLDNKFSSRYGTCIHSVTPDDDRWSFFWGGWVCSVPFPSPFDVILLLILLLTWFMSSFFRLKFCKNFYTSQSCYVPCSSGTWYNRFNNTPQTVQMKKLFVLLPLNSSNFPFCSHDSNHPLFKCSQCGFFLVCDRNLSPVRRSYKVLFWKQCSFSFRFWCSVSNT